MLPYEIYIIKDESVTKNNVYLICDIKTRYTAIVDPGCNMQQIYDVCNKNKLIITDILITHNHEDHVRLVDDIISKFNVNVHISASEAKNFGYYCDKMIIHNDEDVIWLGDTKIHCLLTPGHTLGSTCYLIKESLFSGDTIFIEGCGMCDLQGAKQMYKSLNAIKNRIEDNVRVYPGHTFDALPGKTFSYLKENNIYFNIDNEDDFISFRTRKNQHNLYMFK